MYSKVRINRGDLDALQVEMLPSKMLKNVQKQNLLDHINSYFSFFLCTSFLHLTACLDNTTKR